MGRGEDWEARWKVRPVLIETFADAKVHAGTSYRAAGWECLGKTSGRRADAGPKDVYVKTLGDDALSVLRGA